MTDGTDEKLPIYVSWTTFQTMLDKLAVEGLPNKIDRSVFAGQSGSAQSQLTSGFKFLGLIRKDLTPTDALRAIAVQDQALRKEHLNTIIRSKYAPAFALDLMKTTSQQLSDVFATSFGLEGETKKKAIRFFMAAIGYLGIPVSGFLKKSANGPITPSTPRRPRGRPRKPETDPDVSIDKGASQGGESRTINLNSGGTATFAVSTSFFELSDDDRTFVFSMLDQMKKHGTKYVVVAAEEVEPDDPGKDL